MHQKSRRAAPALVCAAAFAAAGPARAVDSFTLVSSVGDPAFAGTVLRQDAGGIVDNNGIWRVRIATTEWQNNPARDQALVDFNGPVQIEGDPVSGGGALDGWGAMDVDDFGIITQILLLSGTSGSSNDAGVYRSGGLLRREGDVCTAPEFSAGTVYKAFFNVKVNGSASQIVVVAAVDDPAIPSAIDLAVVRWNIDGAGLVSSESVVAKEGDVLPGQSRAAAGFGTGLHQLAVNDAGSVMFFADLVGDETTDGVIYLNSTILAQEGSVSPDPARNWEDLSGRGFALNDLDQYAFHGNLNGATTDDLVLIRNGTIMRREGGTSAGIPPISRVANFGPSDGPLFLDDTGQLAWFMQWGPQTVGNRGLFVNDTLKVQEGFTTVGGNQVSAILRGPGTFYLSDASQFLLFHVILTPSGTSFQQPAAVVLDTGPGTIPVATPDVHPAFAPYLVTQPNPFRDAVEVRWALGRNSTMRLDAYDVTGRLVTTIASGPRDAGEHAATWSGRDADGRRVAPGVYFLRLTGGRNLETRVVKVE
jgi:hypothetical protein